MNPDLYLRTTTCPLCSNEFKTVKVKHDGIRLLRRDSDLCEYYKKENPYFYEINVCPKCGFSFSDRFKDGLTDTQKEKFIKTISLHWKKTDYCGERTIEEAIEAFKLALLSGQTIGIKNSTLAGLCLRISWLYRLLHNKEEEERFMKSSIKAYEKAYELEDTNRGGDISPEIMLYLLGELNFRIGNISDSSKWFSYAIAKCNSDSLINPQIDKMIRDRWIEIKDEIKE